MKSIIKIPDWIETQLPPECNHYKVPIDDQYIHVMEWGSGPPVFMLHGNPTWGFLYRKIVSRLLKKDCRLIVPDLVGLGFSSKPRLLSAHTLENHIRWITKLITALELEPAIVLCQDWGGPIATGSFANHPEKLKGLVVMNTILGPPDEEFRPTKFHQFARKPLISDFVFRLLGFPQRALHRVQSDEASIRGEVRRAYMYPIRSVFNNMAPLALARMVPDSLDHPSVALLRKIEKFLEAYSGPVEVIWGQNDPVLGRSLNKVKHLLPNARVSITQGGHFLQEEEDQLIAEKTAELLQLFSSSN